MDATLTAAMEAYKPEIAARYVRSMRELFEDVVAKHGPALNGLSNCWTYAKVARKTGLRSFLVANFGDKPGRVKSYALNEERLLAAGMKVADDVVAMWTSKIAAKMRELDEATARYVSGTSFQITGTRGGHKVSIDQQMIINHSRLGTLFNQWPSRIYVDGKFTSEAAYKKMFKLAGAR